MSAAHTDLVVLEVVTRWRIDAAVYLLAGASFFAGSVAGEGFARGVVSFVVGFVFGTLLDRISSMLPGAAQLADAAALPDGARHGSIRRYVLESLGWYAVFYAAIGAFAWWWGHEQLFGWFAGWLAAHGVVRIYGAVRARDVEQRDGIVLLVGVGSLRRRVAGYYAVRPTG